MQCLYKMIYMDDGSRMLPPIGLCGRSHPQFMYTIICVIIWAGHWIIVQLVDVGRMWDAHIPEHMVVVRFRGTRPILVGLGVRSLFGASVPTLSLPTLECGGRWRHRSSREPLIEGLEGSLHGPSPAPVARLGYNSASKYELNNSD